MKTIIYLILTSILSIGGSTPKLEKFTVSAYCACEICCGTGSPGITASGHTIEKGDRFVAADPEIPYGTMLVIPGYNQNKPVEVLDRGSAIRGNRLDVFFGFDPNSSCTPHEKALHWGVKYLWVKIIKVERKALYNKDLHTHRRY